MCTINSARFIIFIEHIKSQIECFLLPIDRIIHACDENLIRNCGIETDYRGINTLEDLFDNAAIYCGDECIETLMTFSKSFGQGYADEQLRSCSYCISELIKIRDKMKEKGIKERKVKLALCLSVSFSLILLLI